MLNGDASSESRGLFIGAHQPPQRFYSDTLSFLEHAQPTDSKLNSIPKDRATKFSLQLS